VVKISQTIRNIDKYVGGFLFLVLFLLVVVEVILRAVFSKPIIGSDEISSYLLVWTVLISASYAARSGGHLSLEWIQALLPQKIRYLLRLFIYACTVGVFGVVTASSFLTTWKNAGTTVSSLQLPFLSVFVPIVAGLFMLTLEYSVQLIVLLKEFGSVFIRGH
jgi:TRAP-type C4-dicarboxylate transport system permease small subunit